MTEVIQPGWTRLLAPTGRYEYQFQGRVPAVRNGQYLEAADYQFLVLDEEGWLYKIPVRMAADAEAELLKRGEASGTAGPSANIAVWIAEAQLRAGLEKFRPRRNTPYAELDAHFAVDRERARQLAAETP
jgi:hypothetical protein